MSDAASPPPPTSHDEDEDDDDDDDETRLCRFRSLARRPWARAAWEELAALLSPLTWLGAARIRRISLDPVWKGLGGIVVPAVLYEVAFLALSSGGGGPRRQLRLPPPRALLVPYALSPWALYHGFRASRPLFQTACTVLAFRTVLRSRTLDEAAVALGRRLAEGRAIRGRRYDLYLPPSGSSGAPASSGRNDPAAVTDVVLMLPGAGVSPVAYAPAAALLSDAGMHVAVLNSEPNLRLPSHHLGYDTSHCLSIQRQVLEQLRRTSPRSALAQADGGGEGNALDPSLVVRWHGLSHSMGCFTLSHLDHGALRMRRIVFWGASPLFVQELADLSEAGDRLSLLVVQGSDDKLIEAARTAPKAQHPDQPDLAAQFEAKLPRSRPGAAAAAVRVLPGGTHRGFASYESRLPAEPQSDESRARQQREAVRLTVQFLREDGGRTATGGL